MIRLSSSVPATAGPTSLFVLLWSSGAIFSKLALAEAGSVVFLALRFALALAVLSALALARGHWWPRAGTGGHVALTGAVLVGGYSLAYLLALDHGVTPGVLATLMGLQPLLTLVLTERPLRPHRLGGLVMALAGLVLVVSGSLLQARMEVTGLLFSFVALACITAGTLMQKRLAQSPLEVMPLQYAVTLLMCLALLPLAPVRVQWSAQLAVAVVWLGLVISVAATLLLYRLIQQGNLVNVTSLFYLVPAGTAVLDWLVLGNVMPQAAMAGTVAILAGLVLVYRETG
jgi:drug/metabolite transporter (DMT)-like permease